MGNGETHVNAVGLLDLEVGISISADPVNGLYDSAVGAVDPCGPLKICGQRFPQWCRRSINEAGPHLFPRYSTVYIRLASSFKQTHSIHMSQARLRKYGPFNQIPNLLDVAHKLLRIRTKTTLILDSSRGVSVEIFRSDRDARDEGAEVFAEVVDCELESRLIEPIVSDRTTTISAGASCMRNPPVPDQKPPVPHSPKVRAKEKYSYQQQPG